MLCNQNSTVDSDKIEIMPRNTIDTETEELYTRPECGGRKHSVQHEVHHNLNRGEHCFKCGQAREEVERQDVGRRRKKRTKSHLQHCPSCHCPPEVMKHHQLSKAKYKDSVEAVLNRYENFLVEPSTSMIKKSQSSPLSPRPCPCSRNASGHHRARKAQSGNRRQRRSEEEEIFSAMLKNMVNTGVINESDACCSYAKAAYQADGRWRDRQAEPGVPEVSDADSESPENYIRDRERYRKRNESRVSKSCAEKLSTEVKNETDAKEDEVWWQRFNQDYSGCGRFDAPDYENAEKEGLKTEITVNNQDERRRQNVSLPRKPSATRSCAAKTSGDFQHAKSKGKNVESSAKTKISPSIDASDCSKDEDLRKERQSASKPRRIRSVLRRPVYKGDEESTTNRDEVREDAHCEMMPKDKNADANAIQRNIYAGGDLDLHATKSHILDLIDRALSSEFGAGLDQQKITESRQGSTQREICIEITRALQGDCCQSLAQDLLCHRGSSADYVKQLKILRWEHLNHIQEEFRKLCSLEKFLDACSPRQSLPTLHSNAVEQRSEEQQQQDEKQDTTIS